LCPQNSDNGLRAMETGTHTSVLRKPGEYWQTHGRELPIRSYPAFRYHLTKRHKNGLVESGAVVESPIGLMIVPAQFERWLLGSGR
jgi:hypothetical protein